MTSEMDENWFTTSSQASTQCRSSLPEVLIHSLLLCCLQLEVAPLQAKVHELAEDLQKLSTAEKASSSAQLLLTCCSGDDTLASLLA